MADLADIFVESLCDSLQDCVENGKPNSMMLKVETGMIRIDIYRADDTEAGKKLEEEWEKAVKNSKVKFV